MHMTSWNLAGQSEKTWGDIVLSLFHTVVTSAHQISLLLWPVVGPKPVDSHRVGATWEGGASLSRSVTVTVLTVLFDLWESLLSVYISGEFLLLFASRIFEKSLNYKDQHSQGGIRERVMTVSSPNIHWTLWGPSAVLSAFHSLVESPWMCDNPVR